MIKYPTIQFWGHQHQTSLCDRWIALLLHKWGRMGAIEKGIYEHYLKPGMTVVDAGANQGIYTLLASQMVGPEGKVYAFEPEKRLFKDLQCTMTLNHIVNVFLYPLALGSVEKRATLKAGVFNRGDNRVVEDDFGDAISIVRLDQIVDPQGIDFLKIDVQGYEYEVLQGMMPQMIKGGPKVIFFELWNEGLERVGASSKELLILLQDSGYQLGEFENSKFNPLSVEAILHRAQRTWENFLAIR